MKGADYINRDLFVSPLYIGLCTNTKAYERELRRLKVPREHWPPFIGSEHSHATTHFLEHGDTKKQLAIICIAKPSAQEIEQVYALLVHEAMHVWRAILDHIGERRPCEEFEAYSVQRISQGLFYAYKEAKDDTNSGVRVVAPGADDASTGQQPANSDPAVLLSQRDFLLGSPRQT